MAFRKPVGFLGSKQRRPQNEENSLQFQKPKFKNPSVWKGAPGQVCGTSANGLCYLQMM